MFWTSDTVKLVFAILVTLQSMMTIFLIPLALEWFLRSRPEQQVHAEIITKKKKRSKCFICFQLSDGAKKELRIKPAVFEAMQEGDTGVLSFQERKHASKPRQRHFIAFQKKPGLM